jgi:HemY protein
VIRGLLGVLVLAGLIIAAIFFADRPGSVEIVWQGWQVETSVGVLVAAAVLAGLAVALLFWLVSLILGSPRSFLRRRREHRRRAGYRALTQGMVAVAAGDPHEAQRCARRADALLADPPLTLLLSAQAAQLGGDETAAKKFFTAMLDRSETQFLGLRGLLNQALRAGDRSTALRLTERAAALRPATTWVVESLFELLAREGRWEAARETLAQAVKRAIIPRERASHHRGVILYELSLAALANGDRRRGRNLAARAQRMTPDLAAPAAHHARTLLQDHRTGPAAAAIESAWRTIPHPELAQLYATVHDGAPALAKVKSFERLAAQNPAARESHLAQAQAALDAQLWGEARRHLEKALSAPAPPFMTRPVGAVLFPHVPPEPSEPGDGSAPTGPTPRLCLLMARLEEAEHGAGPGAREWLDRAVSAMPDPRYLCASCAGESLEWRSLCPHCGSFDALAWRTPAWTGPMRALPVAVEPSSIDRGEVATVTPRAAEAAPSWD